MIETLSYLGAIAGSIGAWWLTDQWWAALIVYLILRVTKPKPKARIVVLPTAPTLYDGEGRPVPNPSRFN